MVVIYGIDNCAFCEQAVKLTQEKNIEFKYINLKTPEERQGIGKKFNMRTAPIITNSGDLIGGYTEFKDWVETQ